MKYKPEVKNIYINNVYVSSVILLYIYMMKAKEREMPKDWMGQKTNAQGRGDTIILFTPGQYIETFPT